MQKICSLFCGIVLISSLCVAAPKNYYIDCSRGSDTDTGTSTAHAWQHHPYMQGWTGAYSHSPGDRFFFKGGVTCPARFFQLKIESGGEAGNPDYYGADLSWFVGEVWSRPIFDLEGKAPAIGKSVIVVGAPYLVFDNLEVKNLFIPSGNTFAASSILIVYQHDIQIRNCEIHDWSTNSATDDQMGGVTAIGSPAVSVESSTIYGPVLAGDKTVGACTFNVSTVTGSWLHHCSNGVFGGATVKDNLIHDIGPSVDPSYHENAVEVGGAATVIVSNNIIFNCKHGTCLYPNPGNGGDVPSTLYIYNNVMYSSEIANVQVDMWGQTSSASSLYIYNNTLHCPGGNCIRLVPPQSGNIRLTNLTVQNNHYISDGRIVECWNRAGGNDSCGGVINPPVTGHNVTTSTAAAEQQGYTLANRFAPAKASGATVDAGGAEPGNLFNSDSVGVSRPQGSAWDAGAYEYKTCDCGSEQSQNTSTENRGAPRGQRKPVPAVPKQ